MRFFFLVLGLKERKLSPSQQTQLPVAHACLASQRASCTDGIAPSEAPGTRPRRDMANAFAAVQASNLCQRVNHTLRASACNSSGSSRTLAHASDDRNSAVSLDHLPPTSAPSTTSRALPPSPTSSFYVRSLRRRATSKAFPLCCASHGSPIPVSGDTIVMSMASWAPPWRGRPSATTSSRARTHSPEL